MISFEDLCLCVISATIVDDVSMTSKTLESDDGGPIDINKQKSTTDIEPDRTSQNTDDTVSGQSETPSQNSLNCSESVAENEDEEHPGFQI